MTRSRLLALGVATLAAAALYGIMRLALGHRWWALLVVGLTAGCAWRLAVELPILGPLAETWHHRATDWLQSHVWRTR
jgi:hypothetical protein